MTTCLGWTDYMCGCSDNRSARATYSIIAADSNHLFRRILVGV